MDSPAAMKGLAAMDGSDLGYLHALRRHEIEQVVAVLDPRRGVLLEIGAGTGYQASLLRQAGFDVHAVDLAVSSYAGERVFEVQDYDGRRLPCQDGSVAVVFSSNVLEHVVHLDAFEVEIHRVLAAEGAAVHVLPSPTWRVASILGALPARILRLLRGPDDAPASASAGPRRDKPRTPWFRKLGRIVGLRRHGEKGNALTEIYWFSRRAWQRHFLANGWEPVEIRPGGLFYSGQNLLGPRLGFAWRARLARVLGSSTVIYSLRAATPPGPERDPSPSPR